MKTDLGAETLGKDVLGETGDGVVALLDDDEREDGDVGAVDRGVSDVVGRGEMKRTRRCSRGHSCAYVRRCGGYGSTSDRLRGEDGHGAAGGHPASSGNPTSRGVSPSTRRPLPSPLPLRAASRSPACRYRR